MEPSSNTNWTFRAFLSAQNNHTHNLISDLEDLVNTAIFVRPGFDCRIPFWKTLNCLYLMNICPRTWQHFYEGMMLLPKIPDFHSNCLLFAFFSRIVKMTNRISDPWYDIKLSTSNFKIILLIIVECASLTILNVVLF